jgi:hypothetical protein
MASGVKAKTTFFKLDYRSVGKNKLGLVFNQVSKYIFINT